MEGYIGEIRMFGGNFAPRAWQYCQGQLLSIASNTALFSILGTTFGGNGSTTFALPNFASRIAVGSGTGPGLSLVVLGQVAGSETTTLTTQQMPAHTHSAVASFKPVASSDPGSLKTPAGNFPAGSGGTNVYNSTSNSQMGSNAIDITIQNAGGNQPFNNIMPYLALNFIICVEGIFPSRN
jgi:microcystin-dependent protein